MAFITSRWFKFKANVFKVPIMAAYIFDALVLLVSIPSETSIFLYYNILITYTYIHVKKFVDNIYHFFQEQMQQKLKYQEYSGKSII